MDSIIQMSKNISAKNLKVNYAGPPELPFEELMAAYSPSTILDMDEVLCNKVTWTVVYQNIWDIMMIGLVILFMMGQNMIQK